MKIQSDPPMKRSDIYVALLLCGDFSVWGVGGSFGDFRSIKAKSDLWWPASDSPRASDADEQTAEDGASLQDNLNGQWSY